VVWTNCTLLCWVLWSDLHVWWLGGYHLGRNAIGSIWHIIQHASTVFFIWRLVRFLLMSCLVLFIGWSKSCLRVIPDTKSGERLHCIMGEANKVTWRIWILGRGPYPKVLGRSYRTEKTELRSKQKRDMLLKFLLCE
jgi:hypothetical protein